MLFHKPWEATGLLKVIIRKWPARSSRHYCKYCFDRSLADTHKAHGGDAVYNEKKHKFLKTSSTAFSFKYRVFIKYCVFPRILECLPPLPRQHSAAIGCTKYFQPIGVTVHSHCVETFEGLLQRCRRGRGWSELWKNTLYLKLK